VDSFADGKGKIQELPDLNLLIVTRITPPDAKAA
jgi:hypothetical protein